jgi:hypothetical protein
MEVPEAEVERIAPRARAPRPPSRSPRKSLLGTWIQQDSRSYVLVLGKYHAACVEKRRRAGDYWFVVVLNNPHCGLDRFIRLDEAMAAAERVSVETIESLAACVTTLWPKRKPVRP